MEPNWFLHALSGAGGGLGGYFLFVLRSRKQSSDDLRAIIDQLTARTGVLEARVESLHAENVECLKTQLKMQAKIDQLEAAK